MDRICQTCGDKGYRELQLYCSKCQISMEHRYCLAKIPDVDDEGFKYICEKCDVNQTSSTQLFGHAPRRIVVSTVNKAEKNVQNALNEEDKESVKDEMPQDDSSVDCPTPQTLVERKRKLIPNDSDESDEEITCARKRRLILNEEITPPRYKRAKPEVDPIWKGCFEICSEKLDGIVAYLSSNACSKAAQVSKLMPGAGILSTEMVSRFDTWPKSFIVSPPSDDNIALYFFLENKGGFNQLVTTLMDFDLALRVLFDEAELLIFPSNQLPLDLWRFTGVFYLWGVFRARKDAHEQEEKKKSRKQTQELDKTNVFY